MIILSEEITSADKLNTSTDGRYTVHGDGMFDDLMEAVNIQLGAQFDLGRITGSDYAKVYLSAMQAAMQNAVQYVLTRQEADKKADLLDKQILSEVANTLLIEAQTRLTEAQKETEEVREENVEADTALKGSQKLNVEADTNLKEADIDLKVEQLALTQEQIEKITAEKELLAQKKVTEQAQTQSGVADADSVLGKQIALYDEQSKGFFWNAKKNWSKLTVDAASVDASQGEGFTDALTNSASDRAAAEPVESGGTVS